MNATNIDKRGVIGAWGAVLRVLTIAFPVNKTTIAWHDTSLFTRFRISQVKENVNELYGILGE